jgi:hypothetical protein
MPARAHRRASGLASAALIVTFVAVSAVEGASAGRYERARIGSVAILPFATRGAGPEAWPRLRGALRRALAARRVTLIRQEVVEREIRRRRLRDMSILHLEEMKDLARAVRSQKLLLGYVYRLSDGGEPVVAFSGRLINPQGQKIEAMTFTAQEGRDLQGPLGSGEPVTFERTLDAAAVSFADAIIKSARAGGRQRKPDLLKSSILAPNPSAYFSPDLDAGMLGRMVVLPFRNRTRQRGAGQAAADLISWSLVSSGGATLVEAGDATRRLLERGWRTGVPIGKEEILSLGLDPGVDAVLMGAVEKWAEGETRSDRAPEIGLSARLLDARTGVILWAADHDRRGDETRSIYEVGNVRIAEALLARASYEMLKPLLDLLEDSARSGDEGESQ